MQGYIPTTGQWVDLGPDNVRVLRRAARLLRKEVFHAITLDDPVLTALWVAGPQLAFGDLVNAGLMSRDILPGDFLDPDGYVVEYTVTDKVSFVDSYGKRWVFGTAERWGK